jgi:glycosyltransferase involved in cell wall biosynthesis/predicted O-methyltransferase YrrM
MTGQLLTALAAAGVEVDCFLTTHRESVPRGLRANPLLEFVCTPSPWRYDRWYSRTDATKFATGLAARAIAQLGVGRAIRDAHTARQYDLLYQFSHSELTALRPHLHALPPVILHPEVHAYGELRWHRRERSLALRGETRRRYAMAYAALAVRSELQQRDMRLATGILAPSLRFAQLLAEDYGLDPLRIQVVPNPIDLDRFRPSEQPRLDGPIRLLFVSRLSVRKGVEMVVGLSHRLADLAGRVTIQVIGDHALWSDYRKLLDDLHGPVARYLGPLPGRDLPRAYQMADGLLQPSHYEPFALTVGEALASGLPVITSDEVGASEAVTEECCERFPAGNLDAFEASVRRLVGRLETGGRAKIAAAARSDAAALFGADVVSARLATALDAIVRPTSPGVGRFRSRRRRTGGSWSARAPLANLGVVRPQAPRPEPPPLPHLLERLLATHATDDGGGVVVPLHSQISREYAAALAKAVSQYEPAVALEVGMAFGIASLAVLGAMREDATLISVDPFQTADYRGLGRRHVEEAGYGHRHRLVEEPDYLALPTLLRDGLRIQFAYIDGWHTFDHVLLDLFFLDKMLDVGGLLAFNDCGMPAVHRGIRFLETHRDYSEIDVGLRRSYVGHSRIDSLVRSREDRSHEDRYFEKMSDTIPPWNFYASLA